MAYLTTKRLGIKLIHILNKLEKGRYELQQFTENGTYHIVLYNGADYGVFAGIYNVNHVYLGDALVRLQESISNLNKM